MIFIGVFLHRKEMFNEIFLIVKNGYSMDISLILWYNTILIFSYDS